MWGVTVNADTGMLQIMPVLIEVLKKTHSKALFSCCFVQCKTKRHYRRVFAAAIFQNLRVKGALKEKHMAWLAVTQFLLSYFWVHWNCIILAIGLPKLYFGAKWSQFLLLYQVTTSFCSCLCHHLGPVNVIVVWRLFDNCLAESTELIRRIDSHPGS